MIEVNLTAPIALMDRMRGVMGPGGAIVNISSLNAIRPPMGAAVYTATKGGLDAATAAFARELGPLGIRVNAVAPGLIEKPEAPRPKEIVEMVVKETPLGRTGTAGGYRGGGGVPPVGGCGVHHRAGSGGQRGIPVVSSGRSVTFTHAICRAPAASVVDGLRAEDRGAPDAGVFRAEHAAYVAALEAAGVAVTVLEPLEAFPDSVFVEDPALILNGVAIVLRPGAPSRAGEAAALRPALEAQCDGVMDLASGLVDGGDILCTDDTVMVGLSARTDRDGIAALTPLVERLGYRLALVETPPEILHFKTECGILDPETVLATPRLAATGCFGAMRVIETAPGEDAAANAIAVNGRVFLSAGHPGTAERLSEAGFQVVELPTTQAALVDGGLSCMSLRYSRKEA
jgi:dimethylargininase